MSMIGWSDPVTGRERWVPDEHLVHAAMSGSVDARRLPAPDRAYLVAALARRGLTADETAERLRVSLRLVRQMLADPITGVVDYALTLHDEADALTRAARRDADRAAAARDAARAEAERFRIQRNQLLDMKAARQRCARRATRV